MTPNIHPDQPSIGQCHNCSKPLQRDNFVHNTQTGFVYCDVACRSASEAASAPVTLADADAAEAFAVRQYVAFSKLRDIVTEARQRADAVARLEAALAVGR